MDSNIRLLIHKASESNDLPSLEEAYIKLKKERQSGPSDKPDSVSADLFVLCAETAFKYGRLDVMEDCIKMFFVKTPPSNQFLCRAYLCQAQLYAPTSANNPEQIDKAVEYLLKAINFAKKNSRYYFLVYNASVLYWQFCRPFLKPNYRQYLAKSLHQVVKALDDIDDKDFEWRAQLMIALIECHVDAGRKEDASQVSNATLVFTKGNVPGLFMTVLGLQIQHRLVDLAKVAKEAKASNELFIFYKIQRLRMQLDVGEKVDTDAELNKLYKNIVKGIDMERSSTSVAATSPALRAKSTSPVAVGSSDRITLLLDLGRLSLERDRPDLASDCIDALKGNVKDPGMLLEIEFMKCELMVKTLGTKKETYTKSVVETRIKAVRKLEQFIMTAVRLGNPNVIQAGCVTMWNLCLPLLQSNLSVHVRKPLTLVAQALEDIDSLLVLLRCQMHMELAKCEEAEDQLEYALTHLHKAIALDDSGQYKDRLETALTRLQLRATLYKTPERPEDLAAMIIEQARASDDSSTTRMKRASLVKAGEALSPDAFKHVLASESDTTDPSAGKGPPTVLSKLAGRAAQFNTAVSKSAGHLKRLGDENDQERVRIWADLTKTARKQQVWDVARVAGRFCLLYDDGRWSSRGTSSYGADRNATGTPGETDADDQRTKSPSPDKPVRVGSGFKMDPMAMKMRQPDGMVPFTVEQDLMRTLAQVHLINAEALVQFLKAEGIHLGDSPVPPEDTIKLRPKRYGDQQINFDEIPEWVSYCEWIKSLSDDAVKGFQRAAQIGVELNEPWLVVNAAVYLWNYTNHMLTQQRHREVVPIYTPILEALKDTGHAGETVLLCDMCNAKAKGLMQPWIPNLHTAPSRASVAKEKPEGGKVEKGGKGNKGLTSKSSGNNIAVDPEGTNDLKQAVEVLEFALNVTNGAELKNLVPISIRHPLIKSWVFCKQLLNQQIPKNLGHDDENPHSQGPMSKALCAVEMLTLFGNGLSDFNPCPTLQEVVRMVENCVWSDRLVELEMWSRLAVLAFNSDSHSLVMQCGQKAVNFAESDQCLARKQPKKRDSMFQHKLVVEQEMLYYGSVVMGQSLMKNMMGKNEIRRDALICFVNACRFGQKAGTYDLVITAARHYWNAIKPFIGKPIERELLKEPMEAVLECIAAVAGKGIGKDDEEEEEETDAAEKPPKKKTAIGKSVKEKGKKGKEKESKKTKGKDEKGDKGKSAKGTEKSGEKDDKGKAKTPAEKEDKPSIPTAYDEDLKLRAAMYGVLFQAYADKCQWEQGLRAMDQAVKDMPRTHHRLLIFKHRVITKAKLGRPVTFDMGKFKDENEEVISSMWRHVALNSKDPMDQLSAYQNAVEVLESPQSEWQKVEYLMELGEWLFVNEFPVVDAMDQFLWAADIMLNRSSSQSQGPDKEEESECDSEREASKYVPKKQQSVIGMRPSDVEIKVDDITDVRQLDVLTRIHIMLAQIAGRSSPHYKDYVLLAYGFVLKIWQVSIFSAEKLQKDGAKPGESVTSKRVKGDKGKEPKESQSKAEKAGSKSCIPTNLEGWSTFELPEKIQDYFKCDVTGTMINKSTFQKPMLSVHYLEVLLDDLTALGFHQLGLPVLALLQFLADVNIQHSQLSKLMHLRALELCQELNLIAGVTHHEKSAGRMILEEQEQARSREEIDMWKEEQRQVKAEEERTKASKSVIFDLKTNHIRPQAPGRLEVLEDEPWNNHKVLLGRVNEREVWTKQAELLIRQGHYQAARQLLNEANLSARAFDDKRTLSKVLTQLAVLALAESNWGQAFYLLLEAQKLHGDQKFWLMTTLLLVEATLGKKSKHSISLCESNHQAKEKARGLLMHAKTAFQELAEDNPNKANMANYIEAILRAKLGTMLSEDLLQDPVSRKRRDAFKDLENACQHLSYASDSLLQLGYKREAVNVMLKHAAIKRLFVEESYTQQEKHDTFLEVLKILRNAVAVADEVLYEVLPASTLAELKNLSLPVQREVVDARLQLAELMVDLFAQYSHEDKARRMQEARKGSVEKMIADFVRADSTLSEKEKEWRQVTRMLTQDIFMQLSVTHSLAGSIPFIRAKSMLILGRCLRVLASHTSPDEEDQWKELQEVNQHQMQSVNTDEPDGEAGGVDQETGSSQQPSKDVLKQINNALRLKLTYSNSKKFLAQGVECLAQSVQMGLRSGFRDIVEKASLELVECIGLHDRSTSIQYLALYQSCHMSHVLEAVLQRSQVDPSVSRQAALMYQKHLMSSTGFLNDQNCTVMGINCNSLADCEAWKRLQIMRQHLELTKEFSATNNQFVVLQHSPDRRWLYGAVMDKGRSAVASGKATKQSGAIPKPSKGIIARAKVNPEDLDKLIEEFGIFKSETASELLRRNYVTNQQEQRRKMLDKLEGTPSPDSSVIDDPLAVEKEKQLEFHFQDVTIAMECYLAEVMNKLRPALESPQLSDTVVLLADEWLLQLPLEALEAVRVPEITSLSRDFSLQMHYYRLHHGDGSGSDSKADTRKGGKKDSKGKPDKPSTAKKSDKKGGKDLGGGIPKEGIITDINGFRYIVDVYDECSEAGEDSPAAVITELIAKYKTFTQKWEGLVGNNHLPSLAEWQRLLTECCLFMYYGTERCLGRFPPRLLSPLNLSECHAILLLDLVQTGKSFLRQGRDDAAKTMSDLALEQPLETAMLFSLVGAGCVVLNQWHCRLPDTRHQATTYMDGFLGENKTIGQAVRQLIDFPKTAELETIVEAEDVQGKGNGGTKTEKAVEEESADKAGKTGTDQNQVSGGPPRRWFNTVMYGTGSVSLNSGKA